MNSLLVHRFFTALMISTMFAVPASIAQQTTHHVHYKAVEIPTFGGPASYINPASVFGSHTQINSQSAAVGAAATSIPALPTSNGFVCFGPAGAVPFIYHAFEWGNGRTTDLGTLSGANE